MMSSILLLDTAGQPRHWITVEEAISYNIAGDVVWSLGETVAVYRGGWKRDGTRSVASTASIIAIKGRNHDIKNSQVHLSNRALFGRDRNICAYCGRHFTNHYDLSRDHIMPRSRGGANTWMNCVTACRSCNSYKGNRTLDEAHMELLYLPYVPSHSEHLIIQNRKILSDQMEYLMASVPKYSRIWSTVE